MIMSVLQGLALIVIAVREVETQASQEQRTGDDQAY
jgi:hypothetical protein